MLVFAGVCRGQGQVDTMECSVWTSPCPPVGRSAASLLTWTLQSPVCVLLAGASSVFPKTLDSAAVLTRFHGALGWAPAGWAQCSSTPTPAPVTACVLISTAGSLPTSTTRDAHGASDEVALTDCYQHTCAMWDCLFSL